MTGSPKQDKPKTASLEHELTLLGQGYRHIVGIDEAGRGAWAGPVAAGAVCLPVENDALSDLLAGVRDSKQMTALQRASLVDTIRSTATAWGVGAASSSEIDAFGIVPATHLAMQRALDAMTESFPDFRFDCLFLDTMAWPDAPDHCRLVSIRKGDQHSLSIAAASVLAKVWRDTQMVALESAYESYGFAAHKGYGTAAHRAALDTYGPCNQHRRCFAPIRARIEGDHA